MGITKSQTIWIACALLAGIAGFTDLRWRRIPNWLTVSGAALGIALNAALRGLPGVKDSLLGLLLGLGVLLPFVLIRSLGAGDWKLIGALGAFLGPRELIVVLFTTILVAGAMALILIVVKGRIWQTLRNCGRMALALLQFHLPGREVSLDNPEALKVPFGVAAAIAVVISAAGHLWGMA